MANHWIFAKIKKIKNQKMTPPVFLITNTENKIKKRHFLGTWPFPKLKS